MIRNTVWILVIFLSVSSCNKNNDEMDNEALANIIADMHISEISLQRADKTYKDSLQLVFQEKLAKIHKVSSQEIKKQVELLMEDPKRQSEVYNLAIEKLKNIETQIKRKSIETPIKDQNKDESK